METSMESAVLYRVIGKNMETTMMGLYSTELTVY